MKQWFITFLMALVAITAKSQVSPGDIAFIGFNEDSPVDGFAIITLNSIPGNASINFTDEGINSATTWNGNGEDHWQFTAPSGGIACGTIISFTENITNVLTITGVSGATMSHLSGTGLFNLSGGDQMLAYTVSVPGVPASPSSATFIAGITLDDGNGSPTCLDPITGWSADGGCIGSSVNRSLVPSGLTNGVNCISLYPSIGTERDNSKFIVTLTGTSTALRAAINNRSNWTGDDVSNYDISPSGYATPSVTCVPLPIVLTGFHIEKDINQYVHISWTTASEVNNDYFEIENSTDGQEWQFVSKISGKGNTTTSQYYTYVDQKPFSGTSLYRLKQVDFDGQMSFTPIKSISFDKLRNNKPFQITPNPVTHQLSILGEYTEDSQIQIFNAHGRKMDGLIFHKEQESINVDVSHLPAGLYLLHIHGESLRFIKHSGL
ncbi:MAG: T9SS type A sorting domain-containing protein [Saprospiraceae bacterium]|nr:T9SS type A sorting domain-containing protein [Saprospiraceae bacterium]